MHGCGWQVYRALSGSMNMSGQISGALAPMITPYVLAWTNNNWSVNMWMFAMAYFCGAICWIYVDSDHRLHD